MGFKKSEEGRIINNIPETGVQTGNYEINHYGCWWEVISDKTGNYFWMIGEYPE